MKISDLPEEGPPIDVDRELGIDKTENEVRYATRAAEKRLREDGQLVVKPGAVLSVQKYRKHIMEDGPIIDRLATGETLTKILAEPGMPSPNTLWRWVENNQYNFGDRYFRAQKIGAEMRGYEVIDIADTEEDAKRARVRMDARKWRNAKDYPDKWGDRTILSGDKSNPISVSVQLDLSELSDTELAALEAFAEARQQSIKETKKPAIDVPYEDVTEDDEAG